MEIIPEQMEKIISENSETVQQIEEADDQITLIIKSKGKPHG